MFDLSVPTPIIKIQDPRIAKFGVELYIKREDLTDEYISGNKFRKLKYNLIEARKKGFDRLLTFGGAYSNHIHALAYAGYKHKFKTIGIIRGEETLSLNPTLKDARDFGMDLHYISRTDYRNKETPGFIDDLRSRFGVFYLVPEGGSNALAVKGCTEIVDESVASFDLICCASGTGGTLAGIIAGLDGRAHIWGFPALKNGGFLKQSIEKLIYSYNAKSYDNWDLILDYHFGGYAKYNTSLVEFINEFKQTHQIQLDPVYVGKLMFGIYDLITNRFFEPGKKILAIHTGGLQGIKGFNERFGNLID